MVQAAARSHCKHKQSARDQSSSKITSNLTEIYRESSRGGDCLFAYAAHSSRTAAQSTLWASATCSIRRPLSMKNDVEACAEATLGACTTQPCQETIKITLW